MSMTELNAFVGHSFTDDDDEIVRSILEYLKQIQEMDIGFSWEHAKPAEPKVLAEKVLSLIEDKNLFIGICTKKEKVTVPINLNKKLFCPGVLCAKNGDFAWKTSDWIIQEIGLAIGRGMDVILLVEEGLRSPGGLQGNLEHIPFSRQSPEKSFGKILEMIRALFPKAKMIESSVAEIPKTGEDEESIEEGDEWLKPKPEWNRRNYELALMHMVDSGNKEGEECIHNAYLESDDGKQQRNADSWLALKEYVHLWLGDSGSLDRLEKLAKEKPDNSSIQRYLACGYQQFDEEAKAAEAYILAADKEDDEKRKLIHYGEAAIAYAKAKKKDDLRILVVKIKELAKTVEDGEIILLKILRDVAEKQDDKIGYLAFAERLLAQKPDDNETRFSLAYAHSNKEHEELALYHYLKIPYKSRNPSAWNNLGVAHERLGLEGKAIEAYRKSEENGETLAMDNIAKKYLTGGFFTEAQLQCDKAKSDEGYNKNIDDTLFKLKNKKEDEVSKQKDILDKVELSHNFYVDFGRAAAKEDVQDIKGVWTATQCLLDLEIKDGRFRAYGTYDIQNGLLRALSGGEVSNKKYEILYEGDVVGFAINGTIRISEIGESTKPKTLLAYAEDTNNVLMVISDDLIVINVYQESATYDYKKFQKLEIKGNRPLN